jgi:hypothetical protein
MRIVATTVVREAVQGKERSGYVYDLDWTEKRVLRRVPVPEPRFPKSDDNPRGGNRGGRGVAATRHGIVVANYDSLCVFDDDWNALDTLSHPLFVDLHEIDWDGSHLWVSSTQLDALLKVSLDGEVEVAWDPHRPPFRERFGLRERPAPVDGSVDFRVDGEQRIDECHLNGVVCDGGSLTVTCGLVRIEEPAGAPARKVERAPDADGWPKRNRAAVLRVDTSGTHEVLLDFANGAYPVHNGQLVGEKRIAVNDSLDGVLRLYSTDSGQEVQAIEVPGRWLRGFEPLDDGRALVGTTPAAIALVGIEQGVVEDRFELSDHPLECVHGLALCPPLSARP